MSELAGRVYPDLVDYSTQSYFADPRATPEQNACRARPGQWVKGLMGLKNATDVFNYSDSWRGELLDSLEFTKANDDRGSICHNQRSQQDCRG
jgi:hypothetical protein